jgi:glycosyltransferase involved in cell wall biosynthesis
MTTSRHYTLLVPRLDRTGPCNVAVDVGTAAANAGWRVSLLYLSGSPLRADLQDFAQVRRFVLGDIFSLQGVVHTHCLRPDLLGALLALNRRCIVLTTLHNYFLFDLSFDHARWKVRVAWWAWRWAISRLSYRVCISKAMRRYYCRLIPERSFDLAYNFRPDVSLRPQAGPDILSTQVHPAAAWMNDQRRRARLCLVYVGSLSQRKNLLGLLRALALAPDLSLVLCGQGPSKNALLHCVNTSSLQDRVLFAGQVQQPEDVVSNADALVLASFAEGLPLAVIEAARVGVPAVLSNIAVHRELAAMGLGLTFERHRFSDFAVVARQTATMASASGKSRLKDIWREHFSPEVGFAQYARLPLVGKDAP